MFFFFRGSIGSAVRSGFFVFFVFFLRDETYEIAVFFFCNSSLRPTRCHSMVSTEVTWSSIFRVQLDGLLRD